MKHLLAVIVIALAYEYSFIEAFSEVPTTSCLRNLPYIKRSLYFSRENILIDENRLQGLPNCESQAQAIKLLHEAFKVDRENTTNHSSVHDEKRKFLFNSISIPPGASDRRISDSELAIQTKVRNGKDSIIDLIELNGDRDTDRASLSLLLLTILGFSSAVGAEQYLPGPDIVRFIIVWFLSFSPLAFVGMGIAAPEKLQRVLIYLQKNFFPSYRRRMIYHEAGHFLIGHLLGLPVRKYQANAVKNAVEFFPLSNAESGREKAKLLGFQSLGNFNDQVGTSFTQEPARPYFSPGGRGEKEISTQSVFRSSRKRRDDNFLKLPSLNDPTKAWPYRGFDHSTIDKLAIISMAGVCSEIIVFGNAEGGSADINQLRQIFNYAQPEIPDRDKENKVKFAIGYAIVQLRRHLGALEALADAMEKDQDITECILAIENCSIIEGSGKIEISESGIMEQIVSRIMKPSSANDSIMEGKGGGERIPRFQLSGDDSLLAALATSLIFVIWAFSGGLTLH